MVSQVKGFSKWIRQWQMKGDFQYNVYPLRNSTEMTLPNPIHRTPHVHWNGCLGNFLWCFSFRMCEKDREHLSLYYTTPAHIYCRMRSEIDGWNWLKQCGTALLWEISLQLWQPLGVLAVILRIHFCCWHETNTTRYDKGWNSNVENKWEIDSCAEIGKGRICAGWFGFRDREHLKLLIRNLLDYCWTPLW